MSDGLVKSYNQFVLCIYEMLSRETLESEWYISRCDNIDEYKENERDIDGASQCERRIPLDRKSVV